MILRFAVMCMSMTNSMVHEIANPQLGACLTVSRYSARIVIGCAGNETRAEPSEQSGRAFALLPFALATTSKRVSCCHAY